MNSKNNSVQFLHRFTLILWRAYRVYLVALSILAFAGLILMFSLIPQYRLKVRDEIVEKIPQLSAQIKEVIEDERISCHCKYMGHRRKRLSFRTNVDIDNLTHLIEQNQGTIRELSSDDIELNNKRLAIMEIGSIPDIPANNNIWLYYYQDSADMFWAVVNIRTNEAIIDIITDRHQ